MARIWLHPIGRPLDEATGTAEIAAAAGRMAELDRALLDKRAVVRAGWGEEYAARVHEKGKWTAHERIAALLDPGTELLELGTLVNWGRSFAGSKRLAAALEAGLSEVPCLVERVDDDQARILAAATNVPSTPREGLPVRPERPKTDIAFGAFADCLTAVASSAGLLASGSALTHTVAIDLVRAEAARALHLLRAVRVLRGEVNPVRRPVYPRTILQRVVTETEAERRLRGVALSINQSKAEGALLTGDEELLVASIGALVVAPPALLDGQNARTVSIGVTTRADGAVVFVADHEGAELPLFWRSILADDDAREGAVPGGSGTTSALTLLRAARHVAEAHGGRMSVDCLDGLTSLSIEIPSAK